MVDDYIPNARDAVVAYFGRNARGVLRTHCVTCRDEHPLTDEHRIYGDLFVPAGPRERVEDGERCDICNTLLLDLSQACQREYEEQQARWSRESRIDHVIEYGMAAAVRCRVY